MRIAGNTNLDVLWISDVQIRDRPSGDLVDAAPLFPFSTSLSDSELHQLYDSDFLGPSSILYSNGQRSSCDAHLTPCIVEGSSCWNYSCIGGKLPDSPPYLVYRNADFHSIFVGLVNVTITCPRSLRNLKLVNPRTCEFLVRAIDQSWFAVLTRSRTGLFRKKIEWHAVVFSDSSDTRPGFTMIESADGEFGGEPLGEIEFDS